VTRSRQDVVGWLSAASAVRAGKATAAAVALLSGVAYELNRGLGLSLVVPPQCMCATYNGNGAHYVAHRDNVCVAGDDSHGTGDADCANLREVTAILYTSLDWKEPHGGCLRVHKAVSTASDDAGDDSFVDVAPLAGRLVLFRSKEVLHEVLPSFATRTAVSCWFQHNELCG
jgi:Rps23 Pro-64 3,4-dihydroxylase Tpa1-like proline 4-hydroxylase